MTQAITQAMEFMDYGGDPFSVATHHPLFSMLQQAAEDFLADYQGDFDFLVSVKKQFENTGSISARQTYAVLKCMRRDKVRSKGFVPDGERRSDGVLWIDLSTMQEDHATVPSMAQIDAVLRHTVPDGYYTVFERDLLLSLEQGASILGAQLAYFLDGSSTRPVAFARVYGDTFEVFHRYQHRARTQECLRRLLSGSELDLTRWAQEYTNRMHSCSYCNEPIGRDKSWEVEHPACVIRRGWFTAQYDTDQALTDNQDRDD